MRGKNQKCAKNRDKNTRIFLKNFQFFARKFQKFWKILKLTNSGKTSPLKFRSHVELATRTLGVRPPSKSKILHLEGGRQKPKIGVLTPQILLILSTLNILMTLIIVLLMVLIRSIGNVSRSVARSPSHRVITSGRQTHRLHWTWGRKLDLVGVNVVS